MSNFREFDRATGFLLPPSLDEWLPERHLARFVVEVIDGLDLSAMVKSYRGSGSAGYHPALLLGLLIYGYTTGVFSSRKLERATYDLVAFRFIARGTALPKFGSDRGQTGLATGAGGPELLTHSGLAARKDDAAQQSKRC